MHETADEIAALQELLDASIASDNEHLLAIMTPERRLTAEQMLPLLHGMQVLVVATATADGRPLTSCVDGHFVHGRWVFTTDASATKARHLAARPAVSATHVRGEELGIFTHGTAERLTPGHPAYAEVEDHLAGRRRQIEQGAVDIEQNRGFAEVRYERARHRNGFRRALVIP